MSPAPIEFWFEFASTYSYLGIHQVASLTRDEVRYRPFLLGPVFAAQGMNDSPFNLYPIKGQYMFRDLERRCEEAGLPFRRPTGFPRSGLIAARIAIANEDAEFLPAFCRRVYHANFAEDRDISQRSVLEELLTDLKLDARALLEQAEAPQTKLALRERTETAIKLGIFGAPTYVVNGELFWGSDRFSQALRWRSR